MWKHAAKGSASTAYNKGLSATGSGSFWMGQSAQVLAPFRGGSFDFRGTYGFSRRITTFAEFKADGRYLTQVTPNKPLLRTFLGTYEEFRRHNPGYDTELVPSESAPPGVVFFMVKKTLWASGVDATIPAVVYQTVKAGAQILDVSPEQLGDKACVKNLNHPSDRRDDNIELYGALISALIKLKEDYNPKIFTNLEITSHPNNPKFTRKDLESVLDKHKLTYEVLEQNVPVVSVDNSGTRELAHNSSIVSVDLESSKRSGSGTRFATSNL